MKTALAWATAVVGVERARLELATFRLQTECSPS